MRKKLSRDLQAVLRTKGGEALLWATHSYLAKVKQADAALKILKEQGYTPATMPNVRPAEVRDADQMHLASLLDDSLHAQLFSNSVLGPLNTAEAGGDERRRLEQLEELDWAIESVVGDQELEDLCQLAESRFDSHWVKQDFETVLQLADQEFEQLGRRLNELAIARDYDTSSGMKFGI